MQESRLAVVGQQNLFDINGAIHRRHMLADDPIIDRKPCRMVPVVVAKPDLQVRRHKRVPRLPVVAHQGEPVFAVLRRQVQQAAQRLGYQVLRVRRRRSVRRGRRVILEVDDFLQQMLAAAKAVPERAQIGEGQMVVAQVIEPRVVGV